MGEETEAGTSPVYGGRRRARGVLARTSERTPPDAPHEGEPPPNVPDAVRFFPSTGQIPIVRVGAAPADRGSAVESTQDRPALGAPPETDIRVEGSSPTRAGSHRFDEDTTPRVGDPPHWLAAGAPPVIGGESTRSAEVASVGPERAQATVTPTSGPVAVTPGAAHAAAAGQTTSAPVRITVDGGAIARAAAGRVGSIEHAPASAERTAASADTPALASAAAPAHAPAHAQHRAPSARMIEPLREWADERRAVGVLESTTTGPIPVPETLDDLASGSGRVADDAPWTATPVAADPSTRVGIAPGTDATGPEISRPDASGANAPGADATSPASRPDASRPDASRPDASRTSSKPSTRTALATALRRTLVAPATWLGVATVALCLLGAAVPSFSRIEAVAIESASRDWDGMWRLITDGQAANAVWMWAMHAWMSLFGASEFSLRFVPAVAAGATVAGTVVLGTQLANGRVGVVAGAAAIALPRLTLQGTETTSVAAGVALATWATVALVWAVGVDDPIPRFDVPRRLVSHRNRERRRAAVRRHVGRWAVVGVLLAAATWVFVPLVLVAVAHPVFLMLAAARRGALRDATIASAGAIAASSPLLVAIALQGWRIDERAGTVGVDAWQWFVAPALTDVFWVVPLAVVLAITLVVGVVRVRRIAAWAGDTGVWLAVALLVVPAAALFVLQLVVPGTFAPVYLAMSVPALALLVGIIVASSPTWLAIVLAALVAVTSLVPVGLQMLPAARGGNDRAAASYIGAHRTPGDGIVFSDASVDDPSGRVMLSTYPAAFAGMHDVTLSRSGEAAGTLWDETVDLAVVPGRLEAIDRVWVVRPAASPFTSATPEYAVYAAAGFASIRSADFGEYVVYEFVRTEAFGLDADGRPPQPDELPPLPTAIPTAYDEGSAPPEPTDEPVATTPAPAPVATPGQPAPDATSPPPATPAP